jgi:hypothetical protein
MLIDKEKLLTVSNFAKIKQMTRQHIYRLAKSEVLTLIEIDGVSFIQLDEKAEKLERLRKEKG